MVRQHACFAGVDWASETHHVCVVSADGAKREERTFRHGGAGLAEMAEWIAARGGCAAGEIAVAIEVPHGPVVESLMDRGFPVYSINPKQLDRFRDRFSPAGAKDDSLDARVLADALRTDGHAFAGSTRLTRSLSSYGSGRASRKNSRGNARACPTGCATSSGATTRSFSKLPTTSPSPGSLSFGRGFPRPPRRGGSTAGPLITSSSAIVSGGSPRNG